MRTIDFYSGIGGLSWAYPDLTVVAAYEIDEGARQMSERHFGYPAIASEIASLGTLAIAGHQAECWWMSPPCQPFSKRGRQLGDLDRRHESFQVLLEKVPELLPRWIFLENVPPFLESSSFERMRQRLQSWGYRVAWSCLCPSTWGSYNRRLRCYVAATRDRHRPTPEGWIDPTLFSCVPVDRPWIEYREPEADDGRFQIGSADWDRFGGAMHGVRWSDVQPRTKCFGSSYGKSWVASGSVVLQAQGARWFSPREVARQLGFPDQLTWPSDWPARRLWRLLGNSLSISTVHSFVDRMLHW
ncbi:MAG: DNA cytosine methyltransferase [Pirellulaceae bacterium]|jgi:site-specific DNA-cytosine methylase